MSIIVFSEPNLDSGLESAFDSDIEQQAQLPLVSESIDTSQETKPWLWNQATADEPIALPNEQTSK